MKTYSSPEIADFVLKNFGLQAEVQPLPGELDFNFFLRATDGRSFILKIANAEEKRGCLELQNAVMHHLATKDVGLQVSTVVNAKNGRDILEIADGSSQPRMVRLLTWVDGRPWAKVNPHSPALLIQLGAMCGKLCVALSDFDHAEAHRFMKWDPSQAMWIKPHLNLVVDGERNEWVHHFYTLFEQRVVPLMPSLRKSVNYNDANDYNVLVSNDATDPRVPGVIDFGDVVYTHTVNELAIAIAYAAMDKPDPLDAACQVVKGFNSVCPLTDEELSVIFSLVATRLLISITCAALNRVEHPENEYLQISDKPAWDLLEKLRAIAPELAHYAFRNACGKEACTIHEKFVQWASAHYKAMNFPVKNAKNITWLDLSVGSLDAGNSQNLLDADMLDKQVQTLMADADATLAIGRYDEARALYTTDAFATQGNDSQTWRTVHIGMDFFTQQQTEVFAVCDGTVHSFANNAAERDYGPTIILEHKVADDLIFYTLYGHLSTNSLTALNVGKTVRRGDVIGHVGGRRENGNWPPHLHFQIVLDMLGKQGDFPGVAYAHQRTLWKSICPDPWLLLTGKPSEQLASLSSQHIVDYRKEHLGKNMSISYREPIKMVRGNGVHLLDDAGRRYLDTVNNVAHVGHEHPRVVRAGQRQMAVLNTNTRYLHDNIVKFVEAMLETMPPPLNVAFIVNSGSEANELGMRLARNYTGQKDMIVSEVGYHGNTGGCIEISSYKFDGAGGKGAAPHVHVVPIPDVYRGLYRAGDPHVASHYAGHVKQAIANMQAQGRNPAAFIFESVISCGGQVELPENFLKQAYQHVREAGGVCLADEVQTGCGRAGDHFWAFQQHDVVPDIVTIGKPIGNGHPLAVVVTTQAIADAFKNGMEYFNTFGGNPVSCAIGLEVLKVIKDEGLQQNAKLVGNYLKAGLRDLMDRFPIVGDVRGPGLFIGFELVKDRDTKAPATEQASYFANRMRDKGILMSTDGPFNNVLKIKPPLVFSSSNADFLLDAIAAVLREDVMHVQ
ncbi:aminotransferase class III-fold pyridoxal phosphate-dependent enzyme [Chryseolinea lacunae]|uniref:Aminotransferase class III-fold pyridoxal phosphate-dependent enzyme n=1 Tax=Chryseolinea lacunae TaxID=2801331 RepID=A0ABS1KKC3_9BACT|nr:aminotransferase class III-fold pyridoxal phosphate-dependent enzyme [Chryseolinea lacunae]MBL0739893.1 aminotransferase class III-fold pyridoxal phosphate-dependent enzyme [Chryseolinea lacunae]